MNKLEKARLQINEIDQKMAELFEQRMVAVDDVVSYKLQHELEVLDRTREQLLIDKNASYIKNNQYLDAYLQFLKAELEVSRNYQKQKISKDIIGYQGTYGAFAYIATTSLFAHHKYIAYPTFEAVMNAVEQKEIAYGVIPFENSFTGEVGEVSDLLLEHDVYICQVYDLKVNQNLLGVKGSTIENIKKVYSHPQGLSQSALFLKGRGWELIPYQNTALAAKLVSELQDPSVAAIASNETAELFDLELLESNIQTAFDNTTRFVVIQDTLPDAGNYFQLMFTTKNETGALANAMNLIASHGFNMESIRSRAIPNRPWAYYFHVEIAGSISDSKTQIMLEELNAICEDTKILGSYTK